MELKEVGKSSPRTAMNPISISSTRLARRLAAAKGYRLGCRPARSLILLDRFLHLNARMTKSLSRLKGDLRRPISLRSLGPIEQ